MKKNRPLTSEDFDMSWMERIKSSDMSIEEIINILAEGMPFLSEEEREKLAKELKETKTE